MKSPGSRPWATSSKRAARRWGNMQVITWDFAAAKSRPRLDPRGEGEGLVY